MRSRVLVIDGCLAVALAAVLLAFTGLGVAALIAVFVVVVIGLASAVEILTRPGRRSSGRG